jgi:tagatose-1,6-bisphosphate aldolase
MSLGRRDASRLGKRFGPMTFEPARSRELGIGGSGPERRLQRLGPGGVAFPRDDETGEAEACAADDLLLFVEVLTYRLGDEDPARYEALKPDLGLEAALLVESCGAKVLKLESPGNEAACRRLTDALTVPWAVLSAGVDHGTFTTTLREALAGGASGFIAGRSLWQEAALLEPPERRAFLVGEGRRRLAELIALLPATAPPRNDLL